MGEKETLLGVGIIAGIGVLIYAVLKKKPEDVPIIAYPDFTSLYDVALKDIQTRHLVVDKVKDTLKKVADDIASKTDTALNVKGITVVVDEVKDIVSTQLKKLGSGGGDTVRLFT